MNIGDLVQYRSWRVGDLLLEDVPEFHRGWNCIGVVIDIGDWTLGTSTYPNESATMYTDDNEFIEVWMGDINIINKSENNGDDWEVDCDWSVINDTGDYKLR